MTRAPTLAISDVVTVEGDSGPGTVTFTVRLSAPAAADVDVTYATESDTARAGEDYTSRSGSLRLAVGQLSTSITVRVTGDSLVERNEDFLVRLDRAAGAVITRAAGRGTIRNDD
jgi:hypothetical protein